MLTRDERGAVLGGVLLRDLFASGSTMGLRPAEPGSAPYPGEIPTPAYVYDLDAMEAEARALSAGFDGAAHLIAYAVKANTAGPIVRALASAGCGAEVVSGGELMVALGCGIEAERILMSGVAKQTWEIDRALGAGARGILSLQMESVEEIARVEARAAALGRRARVSLRINPGVVADTHPNVATGHDEAKFGIARTELSATWEALARAPHVDLIGLGCHIGSQLTDTAEYLAAAEIVLGLAAERVRAGAKIQLLDLGGGFGVDYGKGCKARPADFARAVTAKVKASPLAHCTMVVEPGRSMVAAHGVLCATVVGDKRSHEGGVERRWLMIDAGMNDLMRPAIYNSWHRIEPMEGTMSPEAPRYRVVGPVCESSDDFGWHTFARVPERVVIRDAGAYGYTMASEYNGRPLPVEVFLRGGKVAGIHRPRGVEAWATDRIGT